MLIGKSQTWYSFGAGRSALPNAGLQFLCHGTKLICCRTHIQYPGITRPAGQKRSRRRSHLLMHEAWWKSDENQ